MYLKESEYKGRASSSAQVCFYLLPSLFRFKKPFLVVDNALVHWLGSSNANKPAARLSKHIALWVFIHLLYVSSITYNP